MNTQFHPERFWRYPADREAKLSLFRNLAMQPLVTKDSAVTSLGSCFADHIRMFLKDRGYNYVVAEPNDSGASANWGRVYNPVSLRQILDYCLDPRWRPQERWWSDAQGRIFDPYRAIGPYPGQQAAEDDFQLHRALARQVFERAEVVILTYGLAEVWESALDGAVFQARPVIFDAARHRFRVLEYPECLQAIAAAGAGIRRINPKSTIILTVSPVPLRATFRPDVTPVTANAYSKAVLLAAVQTVVRQMENAYYFPSYEIVTECVAEPFRDGGGVATATVDLVMSLFERQFVRL